ncbi:hypothetical protein V8F20_002813 [Naviculisporaceae sp. PSN 640]
MVPNMCSSTAKMGEPDNTAASQQQKSRSSKRTSSPFKLEGNSNFLQWDLTLRNCLTSKGLLQYIMNPTPPRPIPRGKRSLSAQPDKSGKTPAEEQLLAKWRSDRARTTQIITNSLSEKVIKTLLDNEPRAFEGAGNIIHTRFCAHEEHDVSVITSKPTDPEVILDGTNPRSLYDLICQCYPFTNPLLIVEATNAAYELINTRHTEEQPQEIIARFRFLKRSLSELGRGRSELAWNQELNQLLEWYTYTPRETKGRTDIVIDYEFVEEILLGHREKRWKGKRAYNLIDEDEGEWEDEDKEEDKSQKIQREEHDALMVDDDDPGAI